MRYCPQCGWPKEVHNRDKLITPHGFTFIRNCVLEQQDIRDDGAPVYRADAKEYRKRLAAHVELKREF